MYYESQIVPQNYPEALKWFRKAAEKGDTRAQVKLGHMYYFGQGIPKRYDGSGVRWSNV
jgi:uncharacterized protein